MQIQKGINMRIPKDVSLNEYINRLIEEDSMYKFYKTDNWLELRHEILINCQYKCKHCLNKGKFVRADCIHHVIGVRIHPELALSKTYTDEEGIEKDNLIPLCNECHNEVHGRVGGNKKNFFNNKEEW